MIQKRSKNKETSPGKWAVSAAGHVDVGEDYLKTAKRELQEELGIVAPIYEMGKIHYKHEFKNDLIENEFFKVYLCEHEGPFKIQ